MNSSILQDHVKFGGGPSESFVNPAVLVLVLLAGLVILFAARRKALVAFLAFGILIPMGQVLVIGGVHFPMLRVLLLFGFVRLIREKRPTKTWLFAGGFNKLDACVILLALFIAVDGIILFGSSGELIYQAGNLYSNLGTYLLLRFLIRDDKDVVQAIQTLVGIVAVAALLMTYERITGHSPYALLGGANAEMYAHLGARDDKFRAQGPFGHSILAGTFGAVMLPLFWGLWWKSWKYRTVAIVGVVGATTMAIACNSSTPLMTECAGIFALFLWPARRAMRVVRWGVVITLVVLQIVMKHPVWHLLADIDLTGGSSGYHRYMLIDQCIHHFWDWCLLGVKSSAAWGWDMWDTADEYVATADGSGLIPLIFLISILVYGFKFVGRAGRAAAANKAQAQFIWAIGCSLFANVVAYFGISYWDQIQVGRYALLVMISAMLASQKSARKLQRPAASIEQPVPRRGIEELAGVAG